ncbi:hypothetical protein [Archangium sp.]|jgi:hypothetical protein|uniref:hypothetical protein n=1 Tax=Archangium sp. TaxID=1872627 RepID=UPI002ED80FC2
MLVPAKLNPLPGLALAALPPVAVLGFGLAFLSFVGGSAAVWRMANAAGSYSLLMVAAMVGVTCLLSWLLCMGLSGRHAPLVALVGLATLPWFVGIAGTEDAVERVLAALPEVGGGNALAVLVAGTGEAMVTRLLGAWTSAALLVSVSVGLVLLREEAALSGEGAGRLLGAGLGLVLGAIALLVALEAHQLFELLTSLATQAPESRAGLILAGTRQLTQWQELRSATLGALGVLALALVCWQLFLHPEAIGQWVGSMALVVLAAAVLMLDAHPLRLAAQGARQPDLAHLLLSAPVHNQALSALPSVKLPARGLHSAR